MTIPSPPADLSGGYMILSYSNGTDTHKMRLHVRAFGADGTYVSPGAGTPTTVQLDFTGLSAKWAPQYNSTWTLALTALFQNNGDGTFTEIFGWTPPTPVVGTGASASPTTQGRASEAIFNFRDGHGGRGRFILIGSAGTDISATPLTAAGASGGTGYQQIVDYLTNPVKTNIVSHAGHQFQSPARVTTCVNKRLRRHYGFA